MPVELVVYNLAGQLVRRLFAGQRAPGAYEVTWDGKNEHSQPVPSGTYLYRLEAGHWAETKQITIVR
jgi:flagellar hook assembly protein FlgD